MQSSQDKSLQQIQTLLSRGPNLEAKEIDVGDFSRILVKMPERNKKENIVNVINKLFEVAAGKMKDDADKEVLAGLRKYVGMVEEDLYQPKPRYLDAMFFPDPSLKNVNKLIAYLTKAQKSLKICIFNLTNDKLAEAVDGRWQAGCDVKVISDDECMNNQGNDIRWLAERGVPCRSDSSPEFHMHNKFVIVDNTYLITGSFNWTMQAVKSNQENLLVTDQPYYLEKYNEEFERLWKEFEKNVVVSEAEEQEKAAKTIQTAYKGKQAAKGGKK